MKKLLTVLAVIISVANFVSVCKAQVWEEWVAIYSSTGYFNDEPCHLVIGQNGKIYVTGTAQISEGGGYNYNYATVCYDSCGNQEWVTYYDGPSHSLDYAIDLILNEQNDVFVTGMSNPMAGYPFIYDIVTLKYNANGEEIWESRYNGSANYTDFPRAITIDEYGNIYIVGESYEFNSSYDIILIKYNSFGQQQWVARYDGPIHQEDGGVDLVIDVNGNIYVTGFSDRDPNPNSTNVEFITIKYNNEGQQQWVVRYSLGILNDYIPTAICLDDNDKIYVTGYGNNDINYDYVTIKYDLFGSEEWIARYDSQGDDYANDMVVDSEGNLWVTGIGDNIWPIYPDYTTIKYNTNGEQLWEVRYNGPANFNDEACAIALDNEGNTYVTGTSSYNGSNYDFATIKYNPEGIQEWEIRYDGGSNFDECYDIIVDGNVNIYVTGKCFNNILGYNYVTIKYSQISTGLISSNNFIVPSEFSLLNLCPNPFNPTTNISFTLPQASHANLTVYDLAGRQIVELVNKFLEAGEYNFTFDGTTEASGIYIAKLQAGEYQASQKMVLLK